MTQPAEGERARAIANAHWFACTCYRESAGKKDERCVALAAALRAPQPRGLTGDVESLKALARFWNTVFRCFGDNDDLEPLVEAAERAGLIKQGAHAQPCEIEHCPCEGEWTWMYEETPLAHALRALNLSAIEGAPAAGEREAIKAFWLAAAFHHDGSPDAQAECVASMLGMWQGGVIARVEPTHPASVAPASPRSAAPEDK